MSRPARAHIDLRSLQHNFSLVRRSAPESRVIAIIKANAYGHGLVRIAQGLPDAEAFGVACIEEAIELREAGIDRRIVLLEGIFAPEDISLASGYRLDLVLHHAGQVDMLEQQPPFTKLDVWLKLDTGMHRLGFPPGAVADVLSRIGRIAGIGQVRFMTHFACADQPGNDFTPGQIACFGTALEGMQGERSLANSAAILARSDSHADWVRPGLMLYGASPLEGKVADDLGLQPVMTLETGLISVNDCRRGEPVGYGGDWVCPADMKIGVAAIGYGDGYPRHAVPGTPVLVNGQRAGLAGRVSMDMLCIDLSAQPGAQVGDSVTLWGRGLPVETVAASAGTIAYELLCGVGERVHFRYD